MRVCVLAMLAAGLAACRAGVALGAEGDWPTVQHDMQRTGYTPSCPEPPYRLRWAWSDGGPVEGADKIGRRTLRATFPLLPQITRARFHGSAQPMVRGGTAYIGSVEGNLYAIDVKTGATRWEAKASGGILHSVTVGEEAVYAGTLGGVDAFTLDGKRLWTFREPRRGHFPTCPALAKGLVLIGSTSGRFFAIDAATGREKWRYAVGAEISHSPAVLDGSVYFGAEDMHVYSLDIDSGTPNWKSGRINGSSFGRYWPVVAAKQKVVMVHTFTHGGCFEPCRMLENMPYDYEKCQDALRAHFAARPALRSFHILNLSDGKERMFLPTGAAGSIGDLTAMPLVLGDGRVLVAHYSKNGAFQQEGSGFSGWGNVTDWGVIDFEKERFVRLGPTGSRSHPAISRGDDFYHATIGGDYMLGHHWATLGISRIFGEGKLEQVWQAGFNFVRDIPVSGELYYNCLTGIISVKDAILFNTRAGTCLFALESDEKP